ncbi:MAG: hypothetical protein HKP27_14090 [Myxococcales bacterium]|nr:hypothetical protein [Myxococcales bacterium]
MKVRLNIDLTPEEARAFFGLPDMRSFQEELLGQIREQMREGAEGFDPVSLMKPFFATNLQMMEAMRKAFTGNLGSD